MVGELLLIILLVAVIFLYIHSRASDMVYLINEVAPVGKNNLSKLKPINGRMKTRGINSVRFADQRYERVFNSAGRIVKDVTINV